MTKRSTFLIASLSGAASALMPSLPFAANVDAHCTTDNTTQYVYGNVTFTEGYNAVQATIGWTQGNMCTSGVSHSVSLCPDGQCNKWVQSGWRYYWWYSEPKAYCEWNGGTSGTYQILEFVITHTAKAYRQQKSGSGSSQMWSCYIDNTPVASYSLTKVGFASGLYSVVQGEAHQDHVQIGEMAPDRLLFSSMIRRKTTDGTWSILNVVPSPNTSPYEVAEPLAGRLEVWTNAH